MWTNLLYIALPLYQEWNLGQKCPHFHAVELEAGLIYDYGGQHVCCNYRKSHAKVAFVIPVELKPSTLCIQTRKICQKFPFKLKMSNSQSEKKL